MSRHVTVGLGAALMFGAMGVTASQAHEVYVVQEVYDEFCPDTYCGQRAYPDPYIKDGFRHSEGYKGAAYYERNSWYSRRLARPEVVKVHVEHAHPDRVVRTRRIITK
ncbi:hypothetical protein [Terrihabitans rhizophilus]|uniref:Uncharacterized protein n=1 Tax=Terrihabitans rhizophilus TaxID=3092662 RepID=A0ABU4RMG7_9HYPH|nr:hypothetical protein [Terrihabitans sp. PJ23]MDX6806018.1 hypothetical protein [Terrihabitans sp. PJ23]